MANNKKSSRSFDLDKKGKRSFDLEKKSTRTFDLTKDEPEVSAAPVAKSPKSCKPNSQPSNPNQKDAIVVPPTPVTPSDNDNGNEGGNKKKWLWIALAIIVIAILAYLLISKNRTGKTPTVEDSTELVSDDITSTEPNESVTDDSAEVISNQGEISSMEDGSDSVPDTQTPSANNSSVTTTSAQHVDDSSMNKTSDVPAPTGSLDEQAQQVIRGVYGNNPERRQKLGADYQAIQKRVNELMRR